MKIGPRERLILIIAGGAVILIALVLLLVLPQYQKLGALDQEIQSATQDVSSAKSLLAQREQIKDRAAETDAKWLRLANMVPESPDLPSLIIEIQDLAFDSGVQLQSLQPADLKAGANFQAVPITFNIIGTWSDTVDFLQGLMKLDRGIRILSFTSTVSPTLASANPTLPNYSETTSVQIEAYMIPATTGN